MAHGLDNRGIESGANRDTPFGRFGRMFDLPGGVKYSDEALIAIAKAMIKVDRGAPITETEEVDENPTIPAGYTYFGQFIDHDITFDPTPLSVESVDVNALEDFRSPALDLDSVYGRGPADQPYLYDGVRLRVGEAPGSADAPVGTRNDLFRILDNSIPLLGDKRNDENKIVSQIHGAIIAFHNKVVMDDELIRWAGADAANPDERFRAAAAIVRWHYQWVVVHDYLARILAPGTLAEVLNPHGAPRLTHYWKAQAKYAYMPVEFAGAAFRFGHSMVRPSYALNRFVGTAPAPEDPNAPRRIPTFAIVKDPAHPTPEEQLLNLNGFPGTLPRQWGIDWGYFLDGLPANTDLPAQSRPKEGEKVQVPQPSYRIDALLVDPLTLLPEFQAQAASTGRQELMNLAFRNLRRGQILDLPSGEAVARLLGHVPLTPEQVWGAGSVLAGTVPFPGDTKDDFDAVVAARKAAFEKVSGMGLPLAGHTPLWYYILREAEFLGVRKQPEEPGACFGGQHLGPVGSRIIAETFIGMLYYDRASFIHCRPYFRPHQRIAGDQPFTLDRLVAYALG